MTGIIALARLLCRDQWRREAFRRTLLISVIGSLALMALLGGIEGFGSARAEKTDRRAVTSAFDLEAARALLADGGLDVSAAEDPEAMLAARDAHLVVSFEGDAPVLTYDPTREVSLEAYGRAHAAIADGAQARRLVVDELPAARRHERAQLLALLSGMLLTSAALGFVSSLAAGRAGSPAEGLLASPMARPAIAVAVATGAAPTTALQIGAFIASGTIAVAITSGTAGLDVVGVVAASVAATAGLVAVACGIAALGTGLARSHQQGAAITSACAGVVSLASLVAIVKPDLTSAGTAAWVPVVGPQLMLRDAMYGGVAGSTLLAVVGAAIATLAVGVVVGGRLLAAEGRASRS
ncbi:MAG: hypothetical protein ACRDYW_06395 [Acidimicrobiales bacterium]